MLLHQSEAMVLSGWRKFANLGFFLNIFLFPPGDVFSPVQFLGKQGLAFENIGFAGEPSSGHKNAWKHRNFRNLEIKQFQIQGK